MQCERVKKCVHPPKKVIFLKLCIWYVSFPSNIQNIQKQKWSVGPTWAKLAVNYLLAQMNAVQLVGESSQAMPENFFFLN